MRNHFATALFFMHHIQHVNKLVQSLRRNDTIRRYKTLKLFGP